MLGIDSLTKVAQQLNIPEEINIKMTIQPVQVLINGAEVLNELKPLIGQSISKSVNRAVRKITEGREQDSSFADEVERAFR